MQEEKDAALPSRNFLAAGHCPDVWSMVRSEMESESVAFRRTQKGSVLTVLVTQPVTTAPSHVSPELSTILTLFP